MIKLTISEFTEFVEWINKHHDKCCELTSFNLKDCACLHEYKFDCETCSNTIYELCRLEVRKDKTEFKLHLDESSAWYILKYCKMDFILNKIKNYFYPNIPQNTFLNTIKIVNDIFKNESDLSSIYDFCDNMEKFGTNIYGMIKNLRCNKLPDDIKSIIEKEIE